ncbi:heme/hemin ABC transporter substrate-binding protein [Pantoea agglomerans]|uniref:heme/hemin ABC transporter substrate-binding protein n=1 Tax=Enterobacter agglomerans TaxID=549 RepID=UPI00177B1C20|nr:hemin ABC transporter substrate-binding protein [Pantoea agglomerans]MBD8143659.1 hemin ABC transporter substrate-binding protein [Pantoea agglomerans]WVL80845.1 hemin ABC transporter substrate-binding protein [Pantoea agglomerans]
MKRAMLLWLLMTLPSLAAERVVSIGGDVTQIIYALDAQSQLVARDSTSLRPAQAARLPDVGYMRQLNAEGILALKPTLVIASAQAQPSLVLQQIARAGVRVVTVSGDSSLQAIPQKIITVGQALQRESEAQALAQQMTQQISQLPQQPLPVKVLYIMANSGMKSMAAGNQTAADGAIRSAGLENAMGTVPHYQALSQEGVIAAAPDLVVIGEDGLKTLGGEAQLWQLPGLALTPAGQHHRLLVIDTMALLGFGLDTPRAIVKLRQAAESLNHD